MPIHQPLPPSTAAPALHAPATASSNTPILGLHHQWHRTRYLRTAFLSVLALLVGALTMRLLLPCIPPSALKSICHAHITPLQTDGAAPLTVWLRLLWRRFPLFLLLAAAGMTRFSGGLTSVVLILGGLSDGATVAFLYSLYRGSLFFSTADVLSSPHRWLVLFGVCAILRITLHTVMAVEARRLAVSLSPLPGTEKEQPLSPEHLRQCFWQYAAITLATFVGVMLTEGLYIILLPRIL